MSELSPSLRPSKGVRASSAGADAPVLSAPSSAVRVCQPKAHTSKPALRHPPTLLQCCPPRLSSSLHLEPGQPTVAVPCCPPPSRCPTPPTAAFHSPGRSLIPPRRVAGCSHARGARYHSATVTARCKDRGVRTWACRGPACAEAVGGGRPKTRLRALAMEGSGGRSPLVLDLQASGLALQVPEVVQLGAPHLQSGWRHPVRMRIRHTAPARSTASAGKAQLSTPGSDWSRHRPEGWCRFAPNPAATPVVDLRRPPGSAEPLHRGFVCGVREVLWWTRRPRG